MPSSCPSQIPLLPQYKHSIYCPATFSKSELLFFQLGLYYWSHPGIHDSFETLHHLCHQLYPSMFSTFMYECASLHSSGIHYSLQISWNSECSQSIPISPKQSNISTTTSSGPDALPRAIFCKGQTTSFLVIVGCLSMFFSTTGRFSLNPFSSLRNWLKYSIHLFHVITKRDHVSQMVIPPHPLVCCSFLWPSCISSFELSLVFLPVLDRGPYRLYPLHLLLLSLHPI